MVSLSYTGEIQVVPTCSANGHGFLDGHGCQLICHLLCQIFGSILQTDHWEADTGRLIDTSNTATGLTASCRLDKSDAQCASVRILST